MAQFSDYMAISQQGLSQFQQGLSELGRIRQASVQLATEGFGQGQEIGLKQQAMKLEAAKVISDAKARNAQFSLNIADTKERTAQGRAGLVFENQRVGLERERIGIEKEDAADQRWYRREDLRLKGLDLEEQRRQTAYQRDAARYQMETNRLVAMREIREQMVDNLVASGIPEDFAQTSVSKIAARSGGDPSRFGRLADQEFESVKKKGVSLGLAASTTANLAISDPRYLQIPTAMLRATGEKLGYNMDDWKNLNQDQREEIRVATRHALVSAGRLLEERALTIPKEDVLSTISDLQAAGRGGIYDSSRAEEIVNIGDTIDALVRTGEVALTPELKEFSRNAGSVRLLLGEREKARLKQVSTDETVGKNGGSRPVSTRYSR